MAGRLNARLHHQLGMIHTTIEGAFLSAGMLLYTLALLIIVFLAVWSVGK